VYGRNSHGKSRSQCQSGCHILQQIHKAPALSNSWFTQTGGRSFREIPVPSDPDYDATDRAEANLRGKYQPILKKLPIATFSLRDVG
ncbi:MAG: hypothetical protein KDA89_14245, partial [Planctomycetaceae bacterium]|nr:hypothetical protein [Planctomycetaceae bacterium]